MCPSCGASLRPGDRFCAACGAHAGDGQPAAPGHQAGRANGRWSRHAVAALAFARERDHPLLEVTSLRWLAAATDAASADAHLRDALDVATRTQLGALLEPLRRDRAARDGADR
jgi:hypothetical protein